MSRPLRGVSLIDVIVGSFIVLVVFMTLFGLLRASILVSTVAKSRATATSLATSQMEYVRSLSYDVLGTVGGIPAGIIPQYATSTLDGFTFVTRTFIEYVDDPADGLAGADETGITTDYKRVKVAVKYTVNNRTREVSLVSNVVPIGLETSTGGGTLKIDVVGASGVPLPGASVRIVNASTSPTVDVTTFTNANGIVYLPGAATSTQYQITVSKTGYSTAQTYARNATNQNPTPGYLTVAKDQTTTGTFAIDLLTALTLRTFSPVTTATTSDTFTDTSKLAALTSTTVSGGSLKLSGAPGTYPSSGTARMTGVTPSLLSAWRSVTASRTVPAGTTATVQIVDASGTLLPDAVLAGNSSGFTTFPISLAFVSTTTYPTLGLLATLGTTNASTTPEILDWTISYDVGPTPLPNIAFTLQGAKTIGSTGAGAAIYKTSVATTTDAAGVRALSLEWDVYGLTLTGYDVVDACAAPPFTLAPGSSSDSRLILGPSTTHALLVSVRNDAGAVVPGASVTVSRTGFTQTQTASSCGAAYFGNLTSSSSYSVSISAPGYSTTVHTGVGVSGKVFYTAAFD